MTVAARFILSRNAFELVSTTLDTSDLASAPELVAESERISMRLADREPGEEYQIRIGNLPPDAPTGFEPGRDPAMGLDLGHEIVWPASAYLESARGPTVVELRSRQADGEDVWRVRARVELTVSPSKLGEARYQAMFNELRALSAGLVFDLVSKSSRAYRFVHSSAHVHTGSRQLELRAIEQTWRALVPLLFQIAEQPASRLIRRSELRRCWGGERMHRSAVRYLGAHGIDPRSIATPRPFTAPVEHLGETSCTPEHAVVAGFLDLLLERLDECLHSADAQLTLLKGGHSASVARALRGWERIDRPRMERLRDVVESAKRLRSQIKRVRTWALFQGVTPALQPLRTPVFDSVAAYARIRSEILGFLNRAGLVLDEGEGDLIKPTWRMYEQWVLIQVLTALRASGLQAEPAEQLVRQVGRSRSRFTLDFERGSEFLFYAHDGRVIRVRYEPWIVSRDAARQLGETVYRRSGGTDWSPDILIEVLPAALRSDRVSEVEYAVVIDAKYSVHLREERWESTRKYFEIHGTLRRQPIVRQVWLAHPGMQQRILPHDPGIRWYNTGPDIGPDENLHGALELLPDAESNAEEIQQLPAQPLAVIRTFIDGLLAFLDFAEGIPELKSTMRSQVA
jgi:hypothetical protein